MANASNSLRMSGVGGIGKGLMAAVGVTLPGMAALALMVVYAQLQDGALMALNQALKLIAIFTGAWTAVKPGGTRGLALGATVGLLYIAAGYGICALWDETPVPGALLAMEFLLGALLGGISGALVANLPAKGRARRRTA